jgi:protein TonB
MKILPVSAAGCLLWSLGVHATVLLGGGLLFVQEAEFGMELGKSSMEINLVAAAADPEPLVAPEEAVPDPQEIPVPEAPKPDDMLIPEPVKLPSVPAPVQRTVAKPEDPSPERGDGSSPVPGKDKTTFSSAGGVETEAKPNYMKNPPPRYPEESRRLRQQGRVLLCVAVTAQGRASRVTLEKSSGFRLLDESAVQAVRGWKFHPARIGSMCVGSTVTVPVRFQLD